MFIPRSRRENINSIFCRKKREERKQNLILFLNFAHFFDLCGRKIFFLCASAVEK